MDNVLKTLKKMVKWCPMCKGDHENIKEVIYAPTDTLDIRYEAVPDCPQCREARALIAKLEAKKSDKEGTTDA